MAKGFKSKAGFYPRSENCGSAALLLYSLQIAVSNVNNVLLRLGGSDQIAITDPEPIPDLNPLARASAWLPAQEEQATP